MSRRYVEPGLAYARSREARLAGTNPQQPNRYYAFPLQDQNHGDSKRVDRKVFFGLRCSEKCKPMLPNCPIPDFLFEILPVSREHNDWDNKQKQRQLLVLATTLVPNIAAIPRQTGHHPGIKNKPLLVVVEAPILREPDTS